MLQKAYSSNEMSREDWIDQALVYIFCGLVRRIQEAKKALSEIRHIRYLAACTRYVAYNKLVV